MPRLIFILNGPNLNLLGKRQPEIYGHETLADVERDCATLAAELGVDIRFLQSNHEGQLIDWIHEARDAAAGIVINPAAFTHTSVAILDALKTYTGAVVLVTHDPGAVSALEPERVIIMPEGDEDMWSDEYMEIVELA